MSLPVTITYANPDPTLLFTTQQAEVDLFRAITTAVVPGDYVPVIKGSSIPSVADQDKVWFRTDASGHPLGTYIFFSGVWVRERPNPISPILFFSGDPSGLFVSTGDTAGLGLKGTGDVALDYWGWAIANGKNGTADLSNMFIVGATMTGSDFGFNSGTGLWESNIDGTLKTQGGTTDVTLDDTTTFSPAKAAVQAGHYNVSGVTHDLSGPIWGDADDSTYNFDVIPADAGNTSPTPIPIIPSFYALCILSYVGLDLIP